MPKPSFDDLTSPEDSSVQIGSKRARRRTRKDPFRAEGELDMAAVYPESTDGKGHSDIIQVRFPQGVRGAIAALIEALGGSEGPFRSYHDFIRTATFHLLHYWREQLEAGKDIEVPVEVLLSLRSAVVERKAMQLERIAETIATLRQRFETAKEWESAGLIADLSEEIYLFVMEQRGITPKQYNMLAELQEQIRDYARENKVRDKKLKPMPGYEEWLGLHDDG